MFDKEPFVQMFFFFFATSSSRLKGMKKKLTKMVGECILWDVFSPKCLWCRSALGSMVMCQHVSTGLANDLASPIN